MADNIVGPSSPIHFRSAYAAEKPSSGAYHTNTTDSSSKSLRGQRSQNRNMPSKFRHLPNSTQKRTLQNIQRPNALGDSKDIPTVLANDHR